MTSEQPIAARDAQSRANCQHALLAAIELSMLGSLVLAAVLLLWRRAGGAMSAPLGLGWLTLVAFVVSIAARMAHGADRHAGGRRLAIAALTTAALPTAACLAIAVALSLPGTGWAGLLVLWVTLAGSEAWWWRLDVRRNRIGNATKQPSGPPRPHDRWLVQSERRERHGDGREHVAGSIRVDMLAGQRIAHVHVAFCPPLEQSPAIELRQSAGPPARLKLGQSLAHGARFELKLVEPGPASVTLEYEATTADRTIDRTPAAADELDR